MNNFDSLRISDYDEYKEDIPHIDDQKSEEDKIDDAKAWATDALRTIIIPTDDLDDLENQWLGFNEMPKKHRRESDWKSLELFGSTNKDRYEQLRRDMLKNDIDNEIEQDDIDLIDDADIPLFESSIDISAADSYYNPESIHYSTEAVEAAAAWANESDRVIIIPTSSLEELENLWDSFNMMIKKHRRESDWKSEELFGITNLRHYEFLKSGFLREDLSKKEIETYGSIVETSMRKYVKSVVANESMIDSTKMILESFKPTGNIYEDTVSASIVSDILDNYDTISSYCTSSEIPCGDIPYLEPDEMIDMGIFGLSPSDNFYGCMADNDTLSESLSTKEWFSIYQNSVKTGNWNAYSEYAHIWTNKVRELMFGLSRLKESGNDELVNARKQSILELGWDPEIEFTNKARIVAKEFARERSIPRNVQFIDLTKFSVSEAAAAIDNKDHFLKPIFVILTEGRTIVSATIKNITHSMYSHASISLDPTLKKMYSFNMQNGVNKFGGFIEENIKNLKDDQHVNVFAFFVPTNIFNRVKDRLNDFKKNVKDTSYSISNLFTFIFNIPMNRDKKFICSQFVDNCLKFVGIDVTDKDSSLVSPADLDKKLSAKERIYNIYNGIGNKYNASKTKALLDTLRNTAKPIKESQNMYLKNESTFLTGLASNITDLDFVMTMKNHTYLVNNKVMKEALDRMLFDNLTIVPYAEAKEFPVQFDDEGNLLIKNIMKLDYESEYAKSHKLLREYHKNQNTEGIKYELSKLWMMLCTIENELHKDKSNSKSELYNARAKIMNDFKYYLDELLKIEPDFNFTEYYDSTPFSSATMKINRSTITTMASLIKKIISPL